jgi:hypothetical protein
MKLKTSLLLLAAALFPASPVMATVPSKLLLNLVIYLQSSLDEEGDQLLGDVEVMRAAGKDLLHFIEDATDSDFPNGAKIMVDPDGTVTVVNKNGELLADVSEFFRADYDEDYLFDGKYHFETAQERSKIYFRLAFYLDIPDEGLALKVAGVAHESFTGSKPNARGKQTFTGHILCDLTGRGNWGESLILAEGDATLNGKVVEEVKVISR